MTRLPAPRRWPLRPLLAAAEITQGQLAQSVHASGVVVARAAKLGLTDSEADRWAIRLAFHPAEIWPDWADGHKPVEAPRPPRCRPTRALLLNEALA